MKAPLLLAFLVSTCAAAEVPDLKPLLAVPDQIVLQHDFSDPAQLDKACWKPNMGTRWTVADGILRGIPSTPEFQASKKDHQGFEPRISSPATPAQFIARFSVRFLEGAETAIVPFVEFGHHVARIKFTADGVFLLADHDSLKVAENTNVKYKPGQWYHALAELRGEEFIVRFADGATLYAKHPSYALPPPSGAPGMGIAGPKGGSVELDNVTFWTIKPEAQPTWPIVRNTFPKFEPVRLKEKKTPKAP